MRALIACASLFGASLTLRAPARAQDFSELLREGPVVAVRAGSNGKFDRAIATVDVKAPPDVVWRVITDFASYHLFLPKLLKSTVQSGAPTWADVAYEVDAPIMNVHYTFHYELKPDKLTAHGAWLRGDLKDSFCEWRIEPAGDGSLVYYTTASRHFSSIAEGLEDDQQTITIGINVVAAMATLKAVKKRAESMASGTAGTPGAGHP